MLKSLEKGKKTPGNGFAKMKCKEKIAELEKIFNEIDYAAQVTYDQKERKYGKYNEKRL